MRSKLVTGALLGLTLGAVAFAQPVLRGPGWGVGEPPVERLAEVLAQEVEWLSGLSIDVEGWNEALTGLTESLEALEAAEGGIPDPEVLVKLDLALHRVLDILERSAFRRAVRGGMGEGRPQEAAPEWLETYLDEVTAGMEAEQAARVRAVVYGLLQGLRGRLQDRTGPARRTAGPAALPPRQGMPPFGALPAQGRLERGRQAAPPQVEAWIHGYLAGATAGMTPAEARGVRRIAWGAVQANRECQRQAQERLRENASHFLRLRGIASRLDVLLFRGIERQD